MQTLQIMSAVSYEGTTMPLILSYKEIFEAHKQYSIIVAQSVKIMSTRNRCMGLHREFLFIPPNLEYEFMCWARKADEAWWMRDQVATGANTGRRAAAPKPRCRTGGAGGGGDHWKVSGHPKLWEPKWEGQARETQIGWNENERDPTEIYCRWNDARLVARFVKFMSPPES